MIIQQALIIVNRHTFATIHARLFVCQSLSKLFISHISALGSTINNGQATGKERKGMQSTLARPKD
jgi:hypothetical protein